MWLISGNSVLVTSLPLPYLFPWAVGKAVKKHTGYHLSDKSVQVTSVEPGWGEGAEAKY